MTIHIDSLTFNTIIGILDFERKTPQKVIIDVKIDYAFKNNNFINYADLISLIEKQMIEKKYQLLESAIDELTKSIVSKYSTIEKFDIKISKPDIVKNAKVALSSSWVKSKNQNVKKHQ